MASLYGINDQILACIDMETGEILDEGAFNALQLELTDKLENIALYHKNLLSEAEQYKAEKQLFAEREAKAKAKAESLKKYLDSALAGKKFHTTKVDITYRKSTSVSVDESLLPAKWLREIPATHVVDKVEIGKALKSGETIEGATLVERQNIQVK